MNFNDAEITSLYVSENGIQDDAPNAPSGGPFNVILEMVAGAGLTGPYTVSVTCSDLTLTAPGPAVPSRCGRGHGLPRAWPALSALASEPLATTKASFEGH